MVDGVIPEPLGGIHRDKETGFKAVKEFILKGFNEIKDLSTEELVAQRMDKYSKMGHYQE